MYREGDTIVACATPTGESALSIVRLSGPSCEAISRDALNQASSFPRKAVYAPYRATDGHLIDSCVFVLYEKGASSTGEQMLEIFPHGNPLIVRQIIDDLISRGCRHAEPGEFTRRSFLNGKMDLTQAEAVQDLIGARCEAALEAARKQLNGAVGQKVNALLEDLLAVIAHLEAYIDFPEEDLPSESSDGPVSQLTRLKRDAAQLIASAPYSAMLREGVRTVIAGATNAGKSSLLNALLGEERAIVSSEPGTTRDYIEERLIVGPHLLRIVDTAGLRDSSDGIERKGIERSLEQLENADLILYVVDTTEITTLPPYRADLLDTHRAAIVVENKCDLPQSRELRDFLPGAPHVRISAVNSEGIEALRDRISEIVSTRCAPSGQDAVLVSSRHAAALRNMSNNVEQALMLLKSGEPTELAASELREALFSLEEIVGRIDNEKVLDRIFSTFCIGK